MEAPALIPSPPSRRALALAAAAIVLAAVLAYANTLSAPLIFDDLPAIVENPSIRSLATALTPPHNGSGVTGRPLLNLSFALNYALGGEGVRGYHLANLAIHALAGLALFGVVRRTLRQRPLREKFGAAALPLGLATSLLWTLHPLQTESVTCIAQRTESLAGLFYLVAFYGFIRALEPGAGRGWQAVAVAACFAGVATKETMATAPLLALLYDRTFVAGSFGVAWGRRKAFYLSLAASWLLLAWLVATQAGSRGNAEGAAAAPTIYAYFLTQCRALALYLRLTIWPHPLVLDYDTRLVTHAADVLLPGLLVLALLGMTALALWRRPVWGFVGAWFFVILAPSSSFVPLLPQPLAEHRMYLPLAGLIAAMLVVVFRGLGRGAVFMALVVALAFGAITARRNTAYRSAESIWRDTVAHQPQNARAHFYLGFALESAGHAAEAIASYETAVTQHPGYAEAHSNLGRLSGQAGDYASAIRHLELATSLDPKLLVAQKNLGLYLSLAGRQSDAVTVLEKILSVHPDDAEAHAWLGDAWVRQEQPARALPHYAAAVRLRPTFDAAETNWSVACLQLNQPQEALRHGERALQLNAANIEAHKNVALALVLLRRDDEAAGHFEVVLRARPDDLVAREQWERINRARP